MRTTPITAIIAIAGIALLLLFFVVQVVRRLLRISARERDLEERLKKHLEGK